MGRAKARPFAFAGGAFLLAPPCHVGGMDQLLTIHTARPADLGDVETLLGRSYPRLLAADYPPSIMVLAVPIITRARPELLASGRYYLVRDPAGRLLGAGGWSHAAPGPSDQAAVEGEGLTGHVRHLATDPDALRRGIGRALMRHVMDEARAAGMAWLECLSTRTAVRFYAAMGFAPVGPVEVPLRPGITFPAVRMLAGL